MRSKKFQMVDQAYIPTTQKATEDQFFVDLSKHLFKPGLYFVSIPNGNVNYEIRVCTENT